MRLRACLGLILLGAGGCAHIPDHVLVVIDGSTIELRKVPVPEADQPPPESDEPER